MFPQRPADLPDFTRPPVTEVVLGVQFDELPLKSVHLGLAWNLFKERFPNTEDQTPLEPAIERFDPIDRRRLQFRIETVEQPPLRRVWFLNDNGTELLQIQNTRFIRNWRKVGGEDEYPRYERILESFKNELKTFQKFLLDQKLAAMTFNQCEITYVNHISSGFGWNRLAEAPEIFSQLSGPGWVGAGTEAEEFRMTSRYLLNESGFRGRLHVEVEPALDAKTKAPLYVMTLTARGAPGENSLNGVVGFLDLGRRSIVKAFAELTTPKMHEIWRRNV
jgi:uncharacterized protein (TIGR04255 family)